MDKDLIKLLITEYQQRTTGMSFQERPYHFGDNLNYVLVGLRRTGKSYLMYQQISRLLKEGHIKDEILYFNFEDDRIPSLSSEDLDRIKICFEEMFDYKPIFFLDEIQIVDRWEKFGRRLADQGYQVYITGSNAKMLSSEIATTLGGRYIISDVYPFSFQEFLTSFGIDIQDKNYMYRFQPQILKAYENYLRYGGLPEVVKHADKRAWLSSLYQKIFFGDLIARHQIRNDFALRILIRKLAESVKQPVSFNRLANVVSSSGKKISTDTVIDYLTYLKESWLIFSVENLYAKLADKEANKKYYFADTGILNLFLVDPLTSLLENQVAIQLRRIYGEGFYFWQHSTEIDFYVPDEQLAIQVSYSLQDAETRKREVNALLKMAGTMAVKKMIILTREEEETIAEKEAIIQVIPVWKWLLTPSPANYNTTRF